MTKNLISLSLLDTNGFSFQGEGGVLYVCKSSDRILKGIKRGTLYILQGTTLSVSATVASSEVHKDDMTKLWHMTLGHMSERGMQISAKSDLLCGHEVGTADNPTDMFTKLVPVSKFRHCLDLLNVGSC